MKTSCLLCAVSACAFSLLSLYANASSMSYILAGTITEVTDPIGVIDGTGIAPITSTFTGSFTYTTTPLSNLPSNDPADTRYDLTKFELLFDGNYFFSSQVGTIALNDNTTTWGDLINVIGDDDAVEGVNGRQYFRHRPV